MIQKTTEFTVQQRRSLKRLLGRSPVYSNEISVENFLLRYIFLEALCRQVGKYYRERAGSRRKTASKSYETLQVNVVSRAFSYFGIQLRAERLMQLLDSSLEKRSARSARNLRNGIIHRWDENDMAEVSARYSSLCLALDSAVDAIACRTNARAR